MLESELLSLTAVSDDYNRRDPTVKSGRSSKFSYNFGKVGRHEVTADFDGEDVSCHAGLLPIFDFSKRIGLFESLAKIFPDFRSPGMVEHSTEQLVRQLFAADLTGRHDFTDQDRLKKDPLMPVLLDLPRKGPNAKDCSRAASKDTVQRIVDGVSKRDDAEEILAQYYKDTNKLLAQIFVASKFPNRAARRRAASTGVVAEIDASSILLDGNQDGKHYNSHYKGNCYFMHMIYCDNFPVGWRHMTAKHGCAHLALEMIKECVENLRELLGAKFKLVVRGDAAYGKDEIMSYVEERRRAGDRTYFIVRKGANSALGDLHFKQLEEDLGDGGLDKLREEVQESKEKVTVYTEFDYRTQKSWSRSRRVRARLDLIPKEGKFFPNETCYYVITNLEDGLTPEEAFKKYYERGVSENWIKELKLDLDGGHSSMSKMESNAIRFSFKVFAQSLIQTYRTGMLKNTALECATARTIREELVNFGARVHDTYRRFHVSFAESFDLKDLFKKAYSRIEGFAAQFRNLRAVHT